MSFNVFFGMSTGLSKTVRVPIGTLATMQNHVAEVEATLGIVTTQYLDNPPRWDCFKMDFTDVDDEVLCQTVEDHNRIVRWFYDRLTKCSENPTAVGEDLTPEQAATFWHGLSEIRVPVERWDNDYYRARMEAAYEVMRGRESEGMTFDSDALTVEQANAVILLFSQWLDRGDIRLEVPNGHDYLASSYSGEYDWCEQCGAIDESDVEDRIANCSCETCPIRAQFGHLYDDDGETP